ncbi:unnamed protein product [Notodromas monacha]|uniref:Essential MCU regulator, mitochondrial n=1 Tax=Notodromas monacha TaxID=399045 RepID=A0A7R9GGM9_9CRUS|nr:unnamed protein product [Notodromas monacha]CAG0921888.1 unnamed protein product [Notodromas monacha]
MFALLDVAFIYTLTLALEILREEQDVVMHLLKIEAVNVDNCINFYFLCLWRLRSNLGSKLIPKYFLVGQNALESQMRLMAGTSSGTEFFCMISFRMVPSKFGGVVRRHLVPSSVTMRCWPLSIVPRRTAVLTPEGAYHPEPKKVRFGLAAVFLTVIPGLFLGAMISKTLASFLEEQDLFVPSDDDDDD